MSLSACAAQVARGDPDRFAATMAAPEAARARLWPLYAFNLEIARAPWVTAEPMIAEMRLQFWRDVVADGRVPAHEVAGPLVDLIREAALPADLLDRMIEARRWDIWREPFVDVAALDAHIEATSAGLYWVAALALGAAPQHEAAVRDIGFAAGLAAWLRAVPELGARGRQPLPDPRPEAVAALARQGLARLDRGRKAGLPRALRPAVLPAWQAGPVLWMAALDPARVARGALALPEFSRRWRLLRGAFTGRI